MHSTKLLKLLVAALSATTATQAFLFDAAFLGRDVIDVRDVRRMAKRQGDSSGSAAVTSAAPAPTPTPEEETTTSSSTPRPATTPAAATTADPTTNNSGDDTPAPTSTPGDGGSTNDDPQTTPATTVQPTATPVPTTATTVIVITQSDGTVMSSTAISVSTPTPTMSSADSSNNNNNSGMSSTTRNTIIGVVVGVGGAIILAVAGLFAWRIWGRRKATEEVDGLMGFKDADAGTSGVGNVGVSPMSATGGPSSAASPFQSTLEQYHTSSVPPRNVNTAANF